jgi:hypothetical protein
MTYLLVATIDTTASHARSAHMTLCMLAQVMFVQVSLRIVTTVRRWAVISWTYECGIINPGVYPSLNRCPWRQPLIWTPQPGRG